MENAVLKTILVPTGGSATDLPVFETALAVARMSDAHLVFLHVRIDPRDVIASMAGSDFGAGGGIGMWIGDLEADADKLEASTRSAAEAFCASNKILMTDMPPDGIGAKSGITAEWRVEIGRLADCVSAYARVTDLVVAGRSPSLAGAGEGMLEAALMNSGRPVLITAEISPEVLKAPDALNGIVAIAWKDTPEAARAVSAAIPFITTATRVLIVSVQEHAGEPDGSCDRLRGLLRWHNPNVSIVNLQAQGEEPAEILLAEVMQSGIGLLVVGGYGHSRLREAVFGGFTRHLLREAAIPVLMAH